MPVRSLRRYVGRLGVPLADGSTPGGREHPWRTGVPLADGSAPGGREYPWQSARFSAVGTRAVRFVRIFKIFTLMKKKTGTVTAAEHMQMKPSKVPHVCPTVLNQGTPKVLQGASRRRRVVASRRNRPP